MDEKEKLELEPEIQAIYNTCERENRELSGAEIMRILSIEEQRLFKKFDEAVLKSYMRNEERRKRLQCPGKTIVEQNINNLK
jgi:hypothetical protein